ncbi:ABC transporter ATP-binding protein [Poseidonocella sedimentorum]|uniref:Putative ABC transport system ATP-binding protein n=1 Tax=Poseidonocella sedimentorum TaxID=871652 RepID=A0A1I6DDY8_9RHOB|nr:ABC transporter ATP-binding protein [Poseidonocella sedimentorum]SFR03581.1 putative ABC transport system ATP-binding protein [Poseidonocella sedimentorum]
MPRTPPPLRLRDLAVTSPGGRALLTLPKLAIAPGTATVIRGPSGAGKSTLLMALAGLIRPARGEIRWGETDLAALPEPAIARFRRETLGFVFQDHMLFEELSAAENASLAALYAPKAARAGLAARSEALLTRLGLGARGARRVDSFSGGERQRIAVARALATDPPILLADEPTASLDRANADRLVADLMSLARDGGKTVIAVSHDPALIAAADRVLHIEDGALRPESARV